MRVLRSIRSRLWALVIATIIPFTVLIGAVIWIRWWSDQATAIAQACGANAAIVDVNDLGKVEILGASDGLDLAAVSACLRENPHGNSDQQTPIVILKYRPAPGSPAHSPLVVSL